MGWHRFVGVGLVLGFTGSAFASFELLTVLDATDKVIHRYDSETGVYLGNFGGGYIQNPISMVLDQASNSVFVLQDRPGGGFDYVTRLDYNTGAFLGVVNFQQPNARAIGLTNDGRFIASVLGSDIDRFTSAGVFNGWISNLSPGVTSGYWGMDTDDNGRLWALNSNGVIYGWDNPFAANGALPSYSLGAPGTFAVRGQLTTRGDLLLAANTTAFSYATLAPSGGFFSTSGVINGLNNTGVAIGHNQMMYVSGTSGALGLVQRWDRFGNFNGSFGDGQLNNPIAMGVVIAPEPGTMLALGAGIAVLLRRRKK